MIKIPIIKKSTLKLLNFIILVDLTLGGSGRLIMFGSISFRLVLFGTTLAYTVIYSIRKRIRLNTGIIPLISVFIVYISISALFVGNSAFSAKFDFLSRYLYILLVLFYEIYFRRYFRFDDVEEIRSIFETLTFIFAVFSVALWLFAFKLGNAAYSIIEYGFFRPKVYGNFDFIGGGIPRIFMKSSIFIPIGLLFQIDRLISKPTFRKIIKTIIYVIAIVSTFTTGFFIASAICVIILLYKNHVLTRKVGILFFLLLLIGIYGVIKFDLINTILGRFSGEDYSSTYRLTQLESIIKEFLKSPILGHGFAYEYTTVYGSTIRTTSGFEIAWGELLVDTGIIGFLLFGMITIKVFHRLLVYGKRNNTAFVFALGLLLIYIESFTNPFINNSIGLTYLSICAGMTQLKKTRLNI